MSTMLLQHLGVNDVRLRSDRIVGVRIFIHDVEPVDAAHADVRRDGDRTLPGRNGIKA